MRNVQEIKNMMEKHKDIILQPPANAAEIITNHRINLGLSRADVAKVLGLGKRGLASMREYEKEIKKIRPVTYTLFAIALRFHPSMPKDYDSNQILVFKVNKTESVNFALVMKEGMSKIDMTLDDLIKELRIKIDKTLLQQYLSGSSKPNGREWRYIQLAMNFYASGFQIPDLIKKGRESFYISDDIREKRLAVGYSQQEFGQIVDCVAPTISNYEMRVMLPGDHPWAIIMLALNIHPNYSFISGNP